MKFGHIIIGVFLCFFIIGGITLNVLIDFADSQTIELRTLKTNYDDLNCQLITLNNKITSLQKLKDLEDVIRATVTAYTPSIEETDDSPYTTAMLTSVKPGIVAISRNIMIEHGWAPGRVIYIEGLGIYRIADFMNSRYNDRIDIFMWNKKKALKFGKRKLVVALIHEYETL